MKPTLESIRDALDGVVPSTVATCAPDGTPNASFASEVHFVDPAHVALSFQFFNKTRKNVLVNPRAAALVIHPVTGAQYRLDLEYLRTETSGPVFERMKAKLAGIASHTGMSGVFHLLGSDIYRVLDITQVSRHTMAAPPPRRNLLSSLRCYLESLRACVDLASLLDTTLCGLELQFNVHHAMILLLDESRKRLYAVASRGYDQSGVGAEIDVGSGIIGVAAEQRTPIRITHLTADYSYGRAIRESVERAGMGEQLDTEIPLPGLADSRSRLAVPILTGGRLLGVLYVESSQDLRFTYDDEDVLAAVACHLGGAIAALQQAADAVEATPGGAAPRAPAPGGSLLIRHYAADDSVFIDGDYLIKGVAGAILVKLLREYSDNGRVDFTNRELRLDSALGLPDISDNLEARIVLLERRLAERQSHLRIEKTGRGRFRLRVNRNFQLLEVRG